jgi:hypothetical protein
MQSIGIAIVFLILLSIFYSDRNFRLVYLWQILGLAGIALCIALDKWEWKILSLIVISNVLFIALLLVFTFIVLKLRKPGLSFWDEAFGRGDLLFFLAISPLFWPQEFMGFVLLGLLLGGGIGYFQKHKLSGVPLAGIMALLLCGVLIIEYVLNIPIRFGAYTYAVL